MSLSLQGARASKWNLISTIILTVIQFSQLFILSNLLGPTQFGLMGMINVVVGFAQIYSDVGISNAIVSKQNINKNELSSLYYLNLLSGLLVSIIVICFTPVISYFYNEVRLVQPLLWISLIFVIIPIGQQFQVMFVKDLKFNLLAKFDIISYSCGFCFALMSALNNAGVMSLVWGQMATSIIKTSLLVCFGLRVWRPSFRLNFSEIKSYFQFGLYQMGEKTIHFFSTNLDYIIIGKFFGAQTLGYYTFAYQIAILPVMKINPIITQVSLPIFSKVQSDIQRLKRGYIKVIHYLSFINFPIYIGLIFISPILIHWLFAEKWSGSIIFIQILSVMGLIRSTIQPNSSLLISLGRADISFKWTVISMLVLLPCIVSGALVNGALGIAFGSLISQLILYQLNYIYVIRKFLGFCWKEYNGNLIKQFILSLLMLIPIIILNFGASSYNSLICIGGTTFSALFYLFLNKTLNKRVLDEMLKLLIKKNVVVKEH